MKLSLQILFTILALSVVVDWQPAFAQLSDERLHYSSDHVSLRNYLGEITSICTNLRLSADTSFELLTQSSEDKKNAYEVLYTIAEETEDNFLQELRELPALPKDIEVLKCVEREPSLPAHQKQLLIDLLISFRLLEDNDCDRDGPSYGAIQATFIWSNPNEYKDKIAPIRTLPLDHSIFEINDNQTVSSRIIDTRDISQYLNQIFIEGNWKRQRSKE